MFGTYIFITKPNPEASGDIALSLPPAGALSSHKEKKNVLKMPKEYFHA